MGFWTLELISFTYCMFLNIKTEIQGGQHDKKKSRLIQIYYSLVRRGRYANKNKGESQMQLIFPDRDMSCMFTGFS